MAFKRFEAALLARLVLIFAALAAAAWLAAVEGQWLAALLPLALVFVAFAELVAFVRRGHRAIAQILDALRHDDMTQGLALAHKGGGFDALRQAVADVLANFRARRAAQEVRLRHLQAVVNHVPVPLFLVDASDKIALLNHAARHFFALRPPRRLADLAAFGGELPAAIEALAAGGRRLVRFERDGVPQRAILSLSRISASGEPARLVAIHNISGALEATEIEAWQQLVHVLTHEIMNSLTPVASLSATAAGLLADPEPDREALADARQATETVARRAEALMRFVDGYRSLARLPEAKPRRIAVADLFARLETLTAAERAAQGIALETTVEPTHLEILADPELLEQALINLCRNAVEALDGREGGRIRLGAMIDREARARITVADNGPGVADEIAGKVFVPFFTTKPGGSGIGLALTRQVMNAHGGSVTLGRSADGGAVFTLTF